MTVLTCFIACCLFPPVLLGAAVSVIPKEYVHYGSMLLFAFFGVKMLYDGLRMSPLEGQEELEEVQSQLKKRDEQLEGEAPVVVSLIEALVLSGAGGGLLGGGCTTCFLAVVSVLFFSIRTSVSLSSSPPSLPSSSLPSPGNPPSPP